MSTLQRVGIFPASGGIGGSTVKHILPRLPARDLVFIARSPSRLQSAAKEGATVRGANYDDDEDLKTAFEGIDVLFLISYASVENEHRAEVRTFINSKSGSQTNSTKSDNDSPSTVHFGVASSTSSTHLSGSPAERIARKQSPMS